MIAGHAVQPPTEPVRYFVAVPRRGLLLVLAFCTPATARAAEFAEIFEDLAMSAILEPDDN